MKPTYCKGCSFKCQASDCDCKYHDKIREHNIHLAKAKELADEIIGDITILPIEWQRLLKSDLTTERQKLIYLLEKALLEAEEKGRQSETELKWKVKQEVIEEIEKFVNTSKEYVVVNAGVYLSMDEIIEKLQEMRKCLTINKAQQ